MWNGNGNGERGTGGGARGRRGSLARRGRFTAPTPRSPSPVLRSPFHIRPLSGHPSASGTTPSQRAWRERVPWSTVAPIMTSTLRFPSSEWCAAYKDAINANAGYKAAGQGLDARRRRDGGHRRAGHRHPGRTRRCGSTSHQGSCRDCRLVSREEAEKAALRHRRDLRALEGSHPQASSIPTKGMMQNQLKLTEGSHAHDGEVRPKAVERGARRAVDSSAVDRRARPSVDGQ